MHWSIVNMHASMFKGINGLCSPWFYHACKAYSKQAEFNFRIRSFQARSLFSKDLRIMVLIPWNETHYIFANSNEIPGHSPPQSEDWSCRVARSSAWLLPGVYPNLVPTTGDMYVGKKIRKSKEKNDDLARKENLFVGSFQIFMIWCFDSAEISPQVLFLILSFSFFKLLLYFSDGQTYFCYDAFRFRLSLCAFQHCLQFILIVAVACWRTPPSWFLMRRPALSARQWSIRGHHFRWLIWRSTSVASRSSTPLLRVSFFAVCKGFSLNIHEKKTQRNNVDTIFGFILAHNLEHH